MRTGLFVGLMLLIQVGYGAEPDYEHRSLKKELSSIWHIDLASLKEDCHLSAQLIHEGKVFTVEKDHQLLGYVYVGRIVSCRQGVCSIGDAAASSESYEYFDAFVIYNAEKVVKKVKVYNYQATHGQEICSTGWLKQFTDYTSENPLIVGKHIDSISGATISTQAITNEINYVTQLLHHN